MSGESGKKALSGWTLVDSKGEVATDDSRSVSSESSTESFSLLLEDPTGSSVEEATSAESPSERVNFTSQPNAGANPSPSTVRYDEIPLPGDMDEQNSSVLAKLPSPKMQDSVCESSVDDSQKSIVGTRQQSDETSLSSFTAAGVKVSEENQEELGACCEELLEIRSHVKNRPSSNEEYEDREDSDDIALNVGDEIPSPSFSDDEIRQRERHNSDSDSDFVQINEDYLGELEVEITNHRDIVPDRSPSIAEGFNFLGPAGEGIRDQLPGNDNLSDRDTDFDEDVNDDTESSTEDIGDDRIESDQSEAGSVMNNNLTDVGDLSSFADIADLPLIAGDVARNYRHRPNQGLSTVLNFVLIVVSLLTMGISIGLIMATDMEIEEWQQAYHLQTKKVSSLEWTLMDMNKVMQDSKEKVNAYESVLKSFSKADDYNTGSSMFFSRLSGIVTNFESCTRKHGSLSLVDCHAHVMPDIRLSLSQFKQAMKMDTSSLSLAEALNLDPNHDLGLASMLMKGVVPKDEQKPADNDPHPKLQELQLSLQREQERALHWQNLYLLERRQREWERENEDLEDQRERAQWEKEDEEEDRKMREKWEREEAENDRIERLLWEREDQEQDRREREMWEKEDEEEDRMMREKWEKERTEVDNLECLKRLMSTNLTFFKQHLGTWNVSGFDDFVNMSFLMSNIVEMKQSVFASVQQIWTEAEEALNKMGEDVKNGKQPYLDTSIMADYLKQALSILQSQFDDVVNDHSGVFSGEEKSSAKENAQKGPKMHYDKSARQTPKSRKGSGIWNKTVGKIFKKTSKSLRKFVRTVSSSWKEMLSTWEKKASDFMKYEETNQKVKVPSETLSFASWLKGKACQYLSKEKSFLVDKESDCLWEVRNDWMSLVLQEPCNEHHRYSIACNVDANTVWRLKRDLTNILKVNTYFRSNKQVAVDEKTIQGLFAEFWKQWGDSELLLKSDKDWSSCMLKEWSDAVYSSGGWTKDTGRECHTLVNLKAVFTDLDSRSVHHIHQSKKRVDKNAIFDDEGDASVEDVDDDAEVGSQETHRKYSFSQYIDDETDEDRDDGDDDDVDEIHVYEDYDDTESENYDYDEGEVDHGSKKISSDTDKTDPVIKSNFSDESTENEDYKQTAWYLKRAQYRLEMRRAQEKASWFFEMSDHRDEMRKEHDYEVKSGQWLFDQAEDREAQRRKEHEADWVFERAYQRKEDRAGLKWAHENERQWNRKNELNCRIGDNECIISKRRRKQMEDLSKSEWLLQDDMRDDRVKAGGEGRRHWKRAFKNEQKIRKNGKHHKGRQQKNKNHFKNRSP